MQPVIDASSDDVVRAIEDNWLGWLPLFECFEGGRVERGDGYVRWFSAIRIPFFNGITGVPAANDLEAGIDEALAPFDADDIPLLWVVPPSADIDDLLIARGFEIERAPAMTTQLSSLPPALPAVDVSVESVRNDRRAVEAAMRVVQIANGMPDESTPPLVAALERFQEPERVQVLLASVDGVPAASATLFEWAGVAGLYNVGTLPEFRGRGLGTIVSLAAMEAGREDGYSVGVVMATAMGEPLYRSLGFEERCRFTFAVRESATKASP